MTKTTKLEQEIEEAIYKHDRETNRRLTNADIAKVAAEVSKGYIEKALRDASSETFKNIQGEVMDKVQTLFISKWMEENGVTGEVNS